LRAVPEPQFAFAYIEQCSASDPKAPLIVEADGVTYTYADAAHAIRGWGGWLEQESKQRLVRVAGLLENTAVPHLLRVAAARAGVVYTSLSPLLRGKTLLDALDRSGITDIVVSGGDSLQQLGLDMRVREGSLVAHTSNGRDIAFTASNASALARSEPAGAVAASVPHAGLHVGHLGAGEAGPHSA
jgi:acyl-coenzyme A synthetase/AMP-(fatty) acid ligase